MLVTAKGYACVGSRSEEIKVGMADRDLGIVAGGRGMGGNQK